MAETPPVPPEPDQLQYVAYPRPTGTVSLLSDPNKLEKLAAGYFGLNWVFLLNAVLALLTYASWGTESEVLIYASMVALFVAIAVASYPSNRKITDGIGWPPYNAAIASFLMGMNSAACCGMIGYSIMQSIAIGEMNKYGIKAGFFGVNRKMVEARAEELRNQNSPGNG